MATLLQAGYATGIVLLCPLGDIFRRRPYILCLTFFTATLVRSVTRSTPPFESLFREGIGNLANLSQKWLALCLTPEFTSFAGISFICGMTTVTPQLMLPLVGDLAPANRKATSISIVVSGLSLGMLMARLLSGVISNYTDWRNIYWFAFAAQYCIFILLFFFLPDYPSKNPGGLNYFRMMWSIVYMYLTEPLLVQACLINFILSSIFTSFWTTMSFLLSSPPFNYDSLTIGLFALIGIFVICVGPVYSRLVIDKIQALWSCLLGISIEITGVAIGTFIGTFTVAGPVIEAVVIDLGNQACNIANRTAINDINPKARNRVNTCYMIAAFTGQLTGTAVGNRLYALGGWRASGSCNSKFCPETQTTQYFCTERILVFPSPLVHCGELTCGFTVGFLGLALIICVVRGPREKRWLGWSGGWGLWKDNVPTKETAANEPSPRTVEEGSERAQNETQSSPR